MFYVGPAPKNVLLRLKSLVIEGSVAQELDPSSAAEIDREVVRMHKLRKGAEAKERREFANFFDRT